MAQVSFELKRKAIAPVRLPPKPTAPEEIAKPAAPPTPPPASQPEGKPDNRRGRYVPPWQQCGHNAVCVQRVAG